MIMIQLKFLTLTIDHLGRWEVERRAGVPRTHELDESYLDAVREILATDFGEDYVIPAGEHSAWTWDAAGRAAAERFEGEILMRVLPGSQPIPEDAQF